LFGSSNALLLNSSCDGDGRPCVATSDGKKRNGGSECKWEGRRWGRRVGRSSQKKNWVQGLWDKKKEAREKKKKRTRKKKHEGKKKAQKKKLLTN
jgi:hypothetical protein